MSNDDTQPSAGDDASLDADITPPPIEVVPSEVLDELRGAFAPEEEPAASARPATVIVIGDDDLPDAVYLDEEGEERLRGTPGDASRQTIVIGDADSDATRTAATAPLGSSIAIDGTADGAVTASAGIDPRVRARRIGVARAKGRRRLFWVVTVVAIVVVVVGVAGVLVSSLFSVDDVRVQGAVYTDPERLATIADDLRGEPLLLLDTRATERELEQIPWVELATVRKDFPDTVTIDLRERVPVITFVGSDERWRVADRDGRILAVLEGQPIAPMLVAGVGPDVEAGQFAGGGYDDVAVLVVSLPPEIRTITRAATVNPATGDLGLLLDGDVTVNLGQPTDLPAKLARLLQTVRNGLDGIASIDVSTGEVSTTPG